VVRATVDEALLLYSRLVYYVYLRQDLLEFGFLGEPDVVFAQMVEDVLLHLQERGRNEVNSDVAVLAQEVGQRPDGAALRQVTDHGDPQALDGANLLADRVERSEEHTSELQ